MTGCILLKRGHGDEMCCVQVCHHDVLVVDAKLSVVMTKLIRIKCKLISEETDFKLAIAASICNIKMYINCFFVDIV